ncbi:MAG: hypothetical protein PHX72_03060 [Candidatus Shapirobacteria bacterium]|nr:hypothetical protein [Candidatus Shapirobacteria bacterium]
MGEIKDSKKADAIGNLYRVAFFLAQGNCGQALTFLKKSALFLSNKELGNLTKLLKNFDQELASPNKEKYWAEIALDQYKKQMFTLAGF